MAFSNNLRTLRLNHALTQEDVADAIHINTAAYAHYEKGDRCPDVDTFLLLANILHVNPKYFMEERVDFVVSQSDFYASLIENQQQLLEAFLVLTLPARRKLLETALSMENK